MLTLLEKMTSCQNDSEKSSSTKINEHTPSGYSLSTRCSIDATKIGLIVRGKD